MVPVKTGSTTVFYDDSLTYGFTSMNYLCKLEAIQNITRKTLQFTQTIGLHL